MKNLNSHISSKNQGWEKEAITQLSDNGVIVIRDLTSLEDLEKIYEKVDFILKQPSLLGNIGYYQKDPYKKYYDGFLIHRKVIDVFLNDECSPGDLNQDGFINVQDIVLLVNVVLGGIELDDLILCIMDLNEDGNVNVNEDAT